jgi:tetratricopeptide (TPR) repeat protein
MHVPDDVAAELRATARPGKADVLVQVYGEAAAAFAEEDLDEAIRLADQAKHLAMRSAWARELLGLAFYRAERWQEATRELSAFRRFSGSTEQNPVMADAYRALGKPDKALQLCDEIDTERVSEAVVFEGAIVAASTLADMGRVDQAMARLAALHLEPRSAKGHHLRAWYVLADLLEKKGRFTQAREWFDAVASADPDATDAAERSQRLR